jgi:hypothetical protein
MKEEIYGTCTYKGKGKCTQNFILKIWREKPYGEFRRWWEGDIKMYVKEMLYQDVEWINLAQDRGLWQAVMNTV